MILTGPPESVRSVRMSADQRLIIAGCIDRTVRVWDKDSGEPLHCFSLGEWFPQDVGFSQGHPVVVASHDNLLKVIKVESGQIISVFEKHTDYVECATLSEDGQLVVSGARDNTARVWSLLSGRQEGSPYHHADAVNRVNISRDNSRVCTATLEDGLRVWNIANSREVRRVTEECAASTFSSDGTKLAYQNMTDLVVLNVDTGNELWRAINPAPLVTSIALSANDELLATGAPDNSIRLWSASSGAFVKELRGHTRSIECLTVSQDGTTVVSASEDLTVRIWDTKRAGDTGAPTGHTARISCIAEPSDRKRLVTCSDDKTICIWDVQDGAGRGILQGHTDAVKSCVPCPDNRHLISFSDDATIRAWDMETLKQVAHVDLRRSASCIAISQDGSLLAAGLTDLSVHLWHFPAFSQIATMKGHEFHVMDVAVSKDNSVVASAAIDGTVRFWSTETGKEVSRIQEKGQGGGGATAVAFIGDSRRVAFVWDDNTIRVWDIIEGEEIARLFADGGEIIGLHVTSDSRRIVVDTHNARVKVWETSHFSLVNDYHGRVMTETELEGYTTGFVTLPFRVAPQALDSALLNGQTSEVVAWCPFRTSAVTMGGARMIGLDANILSWYAIEGDTSTRSGRQVLSLETTVMPKPERVSELKFKRPTTASGRRKQQFPRLAKPDD